MNIFKRILIILILAFAILFLQGAILKPLLPSFCIPNIFLIIVIYLSFYETNILGLILSFILGLLYDISSSTFLGPWAASYVTIYTIFAIFSGRVFIDTTISLLIITAISSVICDLIHIILIFTFISHIDNMTLSVLIGGFTTAICSPLVVYILKKLCPIKNR